MESASRDDQGTAQGRRRRRRPRGADDRAALSKEAPADAGAKGAGPALALAALIALTRCGTADVPGAEGRVTDQAAETALEPIFDGETLEGWSALPPESGGDWTVEDGVIVGRGSEARLSYLVWHREYADFELRFQYRMVTKGNSGVEVRSRVDASGRRPLEGYHADFGHVGIGPNVLGAWDFHFATRPEPPCPRGTRLTIAPDGSLQSSPLPEPLTPEDLRRGEWNAARVVARGAALRFEINGRLAAEFSDGAEEGALHRGRIALQLHDAGMVVAFRELRVRALD